MLRPEYLAQKLTPYPYRRKMGVCSAPLVMLTPTSWRCRRSADYVLTGNTPVGYCCNKPMRHRLSKKREGATFVVHVECKGPGGSQMLSDVNFTPREDKTIDFSDQDRTYKAVLHRCP